jgi:hypothetical protein
MGTHSSNGTAKAGKSKTDDKKGKKDGKGTKKAKKK